MKNLNRLLTFFLLVLLVASCSREDDIIKDETPVNKDTACDPSVVYFVNDIQPILNSSCAYSGCHDVVSHKDGVILSSYDKVISTGEVKAGDPNGSELYEVIAKGEMPPSGALPTDQRQKIYDWIKQGAKNNKCDMACDTLNVTYAKTVKPVMDNNCMGCHSGANPGGGIAITNYSDTKAIAANGKLLGTIEHKSAYSPMPKNLPKLSDCNISQIKIWINDGMQDN